MLGGSSHLVSMISNHGDRKSPRPGVVPPTLSPEWLMNGGYYPLTNWDEGMPTM